MRRDIEQRESPGLGVPRILRQPVIAGIVLLCAYAVAGLLMDSGGHLGADTGAKVYTLEVMDRENSWTPDIGYWAEDEDPAGELHPVHHTRRQADGSWVAVTTLPMLLAGFPLYSWAGYPATLILPMLGAVLAAFAARAVARRVDPTSDGWSAFWLIGLASPVTIYALDFWEHSLGVGCIVAAVAVLLGTLDDRPPWTGVLAGAALGTGAVMRNEALVYTLVAVAAVCLTLAVRRRLANAVVVGGTAMAGFAVPWFANVWLEGAVEGQSRAARATDTASRVDPTSGTSLRLGERVEEGLQTAVGLVSGDPVVSVLLGGAVVLGVLAAVRAERRDDRTFARFALAAVAAVYLADAVGDLGFVPGLFVAFPLAVLGVQWTSRSPNARTAIQISLISLPIVYLFQFLGGAGPQWGGRYTLASAVLLGVVGLTDIRGRHPMVCRGVLALTCAVTILGVAFAVQRSHEVDRFFEDVASESEDVLIARQAFILREGGADLVGRTWFSAQSEEEFALGVDIARDLGEIRFTVLEWDGDAPPDSALPDDVTEVRRAQTDFVGTPIGLVTYEFIGEK